MEKNSIYSKFKKTVAAHIWLLLVLTSAVLACWSLFQPGFLPTHDGEYHIMRFWQFEKVLLTGEIFPRWAPDFNSGYGVPVFIFNYPLPNYFGVFYHNLGLSFPDSFKLTVATGYFLFTIFCYLWLKRLFNVKTATVATIIAGWTPYWFVEMYVRGSVGEVLAMGLFFLVLASVEMERKKIFCLALCGVILSHNILSTALVPITIGYVLIRSKKEFLPWVFMSLALSMFFWFPALYEQKWVTGLSLVNVIDYFPKLYQLLIPSWGSGFAGAGITGNEMSFQVGIAPLAIIMGAIIIVWKEKNKKIKRLMLFFLAIIFIALLLMQEITTPIWKIFPLLSKWQYPWRLLALLIPVTAFLGASVVSHLYKKNTRVRDALVFGFMIVSILLCFSYSKAVLYVSRDDQYYLSRINFTDGTSSLGNSFTTIWSAAKSMRPKTIVEIVSGDAKISNVQKKPLETRFNIESSIDSVIKIHTLYYPGWRVYVNNIDTLVEYTTDGTIIFQVKPGNHQISVIFESTTDRKIAEGITYLGLLCFFGSVILKRHENRY